ncbi:MAG TPA: THUMP domain-containing protein [Bacteroidales bacterium]|nr:THUMP domain-containing protein [Bacteroidales bacterium]HPT04095.1 THUMP domain-containing protein [Bacteroidales bacterium]
MTNDNNDFPMVAKTITGLEEVLAAELRALGANDVELLKRAVSFKGDKALMYKANQWSRTALRILKPLKSFTLVNEEDLYTELRQIPWEDYMDVHKTLAMDAVVNDSLFTHSHFVALRAKDAVVDYFRDKFGRRPSVNTENPDLRINIHLQNNICDISLDSSGTSLHKRGYRQIVGEAPMSEVLAAGLILLSGWDKQSNFLDPMCGSGTLLIEAALIANNIPPSTYREDFGFMKWKDFDAELWENLKNEAFDLQTEFDYKIIGSDISERNLSSAIRNVRSAHLHKDIELSVGSFENIVPPEGTGMLITNPPYGERIQVHDIIQLYRQIGDTLKQKFAGWQTWVISGDLLAIKHIGLKPTKRITVFNGQLECKFNKFEIYEGSKKAKYQV